MPHLMGSCPDNFWVMSWGREEVRPEWPRINSLIIYWVTRLNSESDGIGSLTFPPIWLITKTQSDKWPFKGYSDSHQILWVLRITQGREPGQSISREQRNKWKNQERGVFSGNEACTWKLLTWDYQPCSLLCLGLLSNNAFLGGGCWWLGKTSINSACIQTLWYWQY